MAKIKHIHPKLKTKKINGVNISQDLTQNLANVLTSETQNDPAQHGIYIAMQHYNRLNSLAGPECQDPMDDIAKVIVVITQDLAELKQNFKGRSTQHTMFFLLCAICTEFTRIHKQLKKIMKREKISFPKSNGMDVSWKNTYNFNKDMRAWIKQTEHMNIQLDQCLRTKNFLQIPTISNAIVEITSQAAPLKVYTMEQNSH